MGSQTLCPICRQTDRTSLFSNLKVTPAAQKVSLLSTGFRFRLNHFNVLELDWLCQTKQSASFKSKSEYRIPAPSIGKYKNKLRYNRTSEIIKLVWQWEQKFELVDIIGYLPWALYVLRDCHVKLCRRSSPLGNRPPSANTTVFKFTPWPTTNNTFSTDCIYVCPVVYFFIVSFCKTNIYIYRYLNLLAEKLYCF